MRRALFPGAGRKGAVSYGDMSPKTAASRVREVLAGFNCVYTEDNEDGNTMLRYDYQNGHFIARIADDASIGIIFPSVIEETPAHLGSVRSIVNRINLVENIAKAYYSFNEEDNKVQIHVGGAVNPEGLSVDGLASQMASVMAGCFAMCDMVTHLHNGIDNTDRDYDDETYMLRRERVLMTGLEMMHAEDSGRGSYIAAPERVTLEDFVHRMFGPGLSITGARVVTDELTELTTLNEISHLDLLCTVIDYGDDVVMPGHRAKVRFARQNATVIIDYRLPGGNPDATRRQIVLNVHAEGHTERLYYVRISGVMSAPEDMPGLSGTHVDPVRTSCSVLVAYDSLPAEERRNEVRFLVDDAGDKIASGRSDELTAEQRMLCSSILPVVDYDLYRGRQAFLDGRYYQALTYLERAFDYLNRNYASLGEDDRETFFNVCHYIGFCYCEMRRYREAYYYLDIIYPLNRVNYTSEYINCLVNSGDFRSIMALDAISKNIEGEKGPSPDEDISSFVDFLKRRRAYVLVDTGQYDEAEKLLTEMLDQPANQDFAIGELAYLRKIRPTTTTD
ncbi:MAG: hypothetical protein NC117_07310 [Pseudoflavonifractor sp.]|nr:hypothetical protein [Pseudoflavonifractor sp.]